MVQYTCIYIRTHISTKSVLQYYIWKIKNENDKNEKQRKEVKLCVCDEEKKLKKEKTNYMLNMKKHIKNMVME